MQNLKNRILNALKFNNTEDILNDISQSQDNLIKNYSNSVVNNKDKNIILKKYNELQNVGKILTRYDVLKKNNCLTEAREQKKYIENGVLKGGISNVKYIWHSEHGEHTCDECRELDGQVFDFYDELPDHPHPNCKCYVEIVENEDVKLPIDEEYEQCDCFIKLSKWQDDCEQDISKIENLIKETTIVKTKIKNFIDYLLHYKNENIIEFADELNILLHENMSKAIDLLTQTIETLFIFYKNWKELTEVSKEVGHYVDYSAEYYHTKANCEAAQLGNIGEKIATILGYAREVFDMPKEILIKHQTLEQAFKNSIHDLEVNEEGRRLGRENPDKKPQEIIPIPEGLPEKYW